MINIIGTKKICCDDISFIENYNEAINDKTQTWDCHHRREISECKTADQLKKENLYYNRPASELIFLTHSEHTSLHSVQRWSDQNFKKQQIEILIEANKRPEVRKRKSKSKKGSHNSEEHNKNISKAKKELYSNPVERKKQSQRLKGKHKDKCWMSNGVEQVFIKQEKIEYYSNKGFHFGRK